MWFWYVKLFKHEWRIYTWFPLQYYIDILEFHGRFDIEMDEETQPNFSGERAEIPTTLIPSPPQENNAQGGQ